MKISLSCAEGSYIKTDLMSVLGGSVQSSYNNCDLSFISTSNLVLLLFYWH